MNDNTNSAYDRGYGDRMDDYDYFNPYESKELRDAYAMGYDDAELDLEDPFYEEEYDDPYDDSEDW